MPDSTSAALSEFPVASASSSRRSGSDRTIAVTVMRISMCPKGAPTLDARVRLEWRPATCEAQDQCVTAALNLLDDVQHLEQPSASGPTSTLCLLKRQYFPLVPMPRAMAVGAVPLTTEAITAVTCTRVALQFICRDLGFRFEEDEHTDICGLFD
jgi:hypothetical protein